MFCSKFYIIQSIKWRHLNQIVQTCARRRKAEYAFLTNSLHIQLILKLLLINVWVKIMFSDFNLPYFRNL
jgi:hypothetical protein